MPSLPLDLERMVFEMAAFEDTDHDNRVRITLVAKRVYEWTQPILYRVAIAECLPSKFALTFRNWRNAQRADVAQFVRHLLTLIPTECLVLEALSTFRNIESLAIWGYLSNISSEVLQEISDLPLHTLSVNLASMTIAEAIENCKAFRNLTHLEILDLKKPTWKECKVLVTLSKLTHLSFRSFADVEDEVILNTLEYCPSLRVLIYLWMSVLQTETVNFIKDDPRYLVFQDDLLDDVNEWKRSANRQTGFWELADIIVEARRDKLFKDNSLFTFSRGTWMKGLNDDGIRWYKERFGGSNEQ